ncbi:MAG: aldehyde dehydrogenase family protein [Christensenellales bacterium]
MDETADITLAVSSIIHSKTFDNGMICASEQSVIVLDKVYDEVQARSLRAAAATSSRGTSWIRCATRF